VEARELLEELLEQQEQLEELELEVKKEEENSSDLMETKVTLPTDNLHVKKKPWVEEMEEIDLHLLTTITILVRLKF
jgi:hypothetical protein